MAFSARVPSGDVRLDLRDEVFHGTRTGDRFVPLAADPASQRPRQGALPPEIRKYFG
ncbi:hypothetical protein ACFW34_09805 [Streptomyces sp. NPDC058848]|uniref:hypothetical protein n=1 Tax=unclassified Streptomyces TaxID=2593676 RepID=UPI0036C988F4